MFSKKAYFFDISLALNSLLILRSTGKTKQLKTPVLHLNTKKKSFPAVQVTPAMMIVFNFESLGLKGLIMALYLKIENYEMKLKKPLLFSFCTVNGVGLKYTCQLRLLPK